MPGKTKYKQDAYVRCPYYRKETAIEVKCEGLCGMNTINVYESGKAKQEYKEDFCCGFYWNCPLYIGLETDGK